MKLTRTFIGVVLIGVLGQAIGADIVIGTGSRAGVYYQAGRNICRLVNEGIVDSAINCQALSTPGSISNLERVRNGRLQLGLAQSDWQYHAYQGSGRLQPQGPDTNLRSLFSLHSEPFTLVARSDADINSLDDLPGKRVNIGNPGSGQRATMEVVMDAMGWDMDVFSLVNELPASQQSMALCHDRVQAMIYTVGHPNPSVAQASGLCDAVIGEVQGPEIDRLVNDNSFYAYTQVPGGLYAGNPDPVTTFGVRATVVASSDLDPDLIYAITKAVFDNLDKLKIAHPAFAYLSKEEMVTDGLSAPLHEGARRYYLEQGLISQ